MVFEELVVQYGFAGAVFVYFVYDQVTFKPAITKAIENNTIAMTKVYEVMNHCKKKIQNNVLK